MKKALCIIISLILCLSFVSCGSSGETSEESKTKETESKDTSETEDPGTVIDDVPDDTNFELHGGAAYYKGYTYFVSLCAENDGSVNGTEFASGIYRIRDGSDEPELITAVPAEILYGIPYTNVACLLPTENYIYFATEVNDVPGFYRVDHNGSKIENIDFCIGEALYRDGNMLYTIHEGGDLLCYDISSGKSSSVSSPIKLKSSERSYIIDICDGYIYYFLLTDGDPTGICRVSLEGGKTEQIADARGVDDAVLALVRYGKVYIICEINDENGLFSFDVATGERKKVCAIPRHSLSVNISGGKIWYIGEHGLTAVDAETLEETVVVNCECDPKDFFALYIAGERVLFMNEEIDSIAMMNKTDRFFPASGAIEIEEAERISSGDWEYIVHPRFIEIREYLGSSSVVNVPASIDGLPVRIVGLNNYSSENITEVNIPEGVACVTWCGGKAIRKMTLPSTLDCVYRIASSFNVASDCVIEFNGTLADWAKICDKAEKFDYSADTRGAEDATLVCKDGSKRLGDK